MNTHIIKNNQRLNAYPALFGEFNYKGMPLFIYAENLFYSGLSQMVTGYQGGYFDFFKVIEKENISEIEPKGFIPLMLSDERVELSSPFGVTETLSLRGASMVVWTFIIDQIAMNITDTVVASRLYRVIQDLKYIYSELMDEKGNKIFTPEDCNAIYKLLD